MDFKTHQHRQGEVVLNQPQYLSLYNEIKEVILHITDEEIRDRHLAKYSNKMSLSYAINDLLRDGFVKKGWMKEAPIFQEEGYRESKWRLDFAKDKVSIEVGFNHGEAIAWNLLKPVLASELNHVKKAIQTEVGVVICATKALKTDGAFDSAVGEYEKILRYLIPLNDVLTVPMVIIGLETMKSFKVNKVMTNGRNVGNIVPKI